VGLSGPQTAGPVGSREGERSLLDHYLNYVRPLALRRSLVGATALLVAAGCSKESGEDGANYYLSGRFIDGTRLAPVPDAELAVLAVSNVSRMLSVEAGAASIGPIVPPGSRRS